MAERLRNDLSISSAKLSSDDSMRVVMRTRTFSPVDALAGSGLACRDSEPSQLEIAHIIIVMVIVTCTDGHEEFKPSHALC